MAAIRRIIVVMLGIAGVCLALALTNVRVLVWQTITLASDQYILESSDSASERFLMCRYFTGWGLVKREYAYDSAKVFGRSRCPLILGN